MSLQDAAVGPIDMQKWLSDLKSGAVQPKTAEATIYLDPEIVEKYDALVGEFNVLAAASKEVADSGGDRLASEPADPYAAELDRLEAEIAELETQVGAVTQTFVFRGYRDGDQAAIRAGVKKLDGDDANDKALIFGIAHFCISPKLTPEDVKAMIPVIGFAQFNVLASTYQQHVYGAPSGPKSLKPSRSRGTTKR